MGRIFCFILILINSRYIQASDELEWYQFNESSPEVFCVGRVINKKVAFPTYLEIRQDKKMEKEFEALLTLGIRYIIPPIDDSWIPYAVEYKTFTLKEVSKHIVNNEKVCVSTLVFAHLASRLKEGDHVDVDKYISPKDFCVVPKVGEKKKPDSQSPTSKPLSPSGLSVSLHGFESTENILDSELALNEFNHNETFQSDLFLSSTHHCPAIEFDCDAYEDYFEWENEKTKQIFESVRDEVVARIKNKENFTEGTRFTLENNLKESIRLIKEIPVNTEVKGALLPAALVPVTVPMVNLTTMAIIHASRLQSHQLGTLLSRLGIILYTSRFKQFLAKEKDLKKREAMLLDIQDKSHYLTRQVISLRHLDDIYPNLEYLRGQFRFYSANPKDQLLAHVQSTPWNKDTHTQQLTLKEEDDNTKDSTADEDSSKSDPKFPDEKGLADKFDIETSEIHDLKEEILKGVDKKTRKRAGNADIGVNKDGDIFLKNRKTKEIFETDLKVDWFKNSN